MNHFENRQKAAGLGDDELEAAFKCIAEMFSLKWVQSPRTNPLQQLWARKDVLATNELYFFGKCLEKTVLKDSKWAKQQINIIKTGTENNLRGALFEITGLGMLSSPTQNIIPAKGKNPGYDGTLQLDTDRLMRLSLKNYGDSESFKDFTAKAADFEKKLEGWLTEKRMPPVQVFIEAVEHFPSRNDWNALTAYFPLFLDQANTKKSKAFAIDKVWIGACTDLHLGFQEFHPAKNSYTLIISSPYHKNEEKNLLDKLDEACANLVKHSKIEDERTINAAFIRLSENASLKRCMDWGLEYFSNFPDKPISCIFFYQPTVATDLSNDTNFIQHAFQIITRTAKTNNWSQANHITINLPVGVIGGIPTTNKLIAEVNGKKEVFDFSEKYVFQRGNHYLAQKERPDGSKVGNINRVASGVFTHSVFEPFPGQGSFVLSGRFAPVDKLLIL